MKNLNFILALLLMTLYACHEEHEMAKPISVDPPIITTPTTSLVHTVTEGNESSVYTYDDFNKLVKVEYNEGHSEIEYLEGLAIQRIFDEDSTLHYFTTFEFNDKDLYSHRTVSNNASYSESLTYNDQGYLIKTTSVNGATTLESNHYYTNNNLDSTVYIRDGELAYTYKYTYINKPNSLNNHAYGRPYYGNTSKNLIKNWRGFRPDGSIFIQVAFAYTFDHKARVATMTQVSDDDISTFHYTYY